jgi:hypothetical protein
MGGGGLNRRVYGGGLLNLNLQLYLTYSSGLW